MISKKYNHGDADSGRYHPSKGKGGYDFGF